jgi:hypothetical protein
VTHTIVPVPCRWTVDDVLGNHPGAKIVRIYLNGREAVTLYWDGTNLTECSAEAVALLSTKPDNRLETKSHD